MLDLILHLDQHLVNLTATYGAVVYLFLFLIIFCETGLVILPFLPGDSLLFASGTIAALGGLNYISLLIILSIAAILGDTVNYWIGHFFGEKLIKHPQSPLKPQHIQKTHAFYAKYGGKTIVLARFVPIVRTFAPFVAGVGNMNYRHFFIFNVIGGIAWVTLFTTAGYFFGNIPTIKHNFSLVIFAIIGISLIPMAYEYLHSKRHS
jgi:membrane-associated protein